MGAYFGVSTIFILCLLGFSANAEVFNIGSSSGSDITQVSHIPLYFFSSFLRYKQSTKTTFLA